MVNLPFREEYPGGRQWNVDAPQFRFRPAELADDEAPHHPHWDLIFDHIGRELTPALRDLPWADEANIKTGADYLRRWVACCFRDPFEPTPYLFLFGPENSRGITSRFRKGTVRFSLRDNWDSPQEALSVPVTKGVVPADRALSK